MLPPTPSQDPQDLQAIIQNSANKINELQVMNSILVDRIAILAPLGKGKDLNEVERGMLLAELLWLAARFEQKAKNSSDWDKKSTEKEKIWT